MGRLGATRAPFALAACYSHVNVGSVARRGGIGATSTKGTSCCRYGTLSPRGPGWPSPRWRWSSSWPPHSRRPRRPLRGITSRSAIRSPRACSRTCPGSLETNQGYADQLYAILRGRIRNLQLVKFGCPGDTTTSLLTGKGNAALAKFFKCNRTGGSQLKAAQRFFKAHHKRGEIVLVTLDIGANDVDGCTAPGVNVGKCVATGQANIKNLTPKILSGIRTSVGQGDEARVDDPV